MSVSVKLLATVSAWLASNGDPKKEKTIQKILSSDEHRALPYQHLVVFARRSRAARVSDLAAPTKLCPLACVAALTAAEQQLVKSLPTDTGRNLLKEVRTQLIETARPLMEAMVQEATGVKVVSLHHDISTVIGEEVVLFTLAKLPQFRETKGVA